MKKQFTMTLANLAEVEMYWSPAARRILARAPAAVRKFVLPRDARLIGRYASPFSSVDFAGDLDDVLDEIDRMARSVRRVQATIG